MCPVVLFAPPRGVAVLACGLCCVVFASASIGSLRRTAPADRSPAGHRRDLHPHRHPQQQCAAGRQQKDQQQARSEQPPMRRRPPAAAIPSSAALPGHPRPSSRRGPGACSGSHAAGHPVARSRHPDDTASTAASTAPARGGHARLRRHRAIEHAGAGRWTPLQRFRHRRVRFQSDSPQQHRPHRDHPRQQRRRALRRRCGRRRHQHRDQERRRGCSPNARIEGAFGSFNTREAQMRRSAAPTTDWSTAAFGNAFSSDGYRANNETQAESGRWRLPIHDQRRQRLLQHLRR